MTVQKQSGINVMSLRDRSQASNTEASELPKDVLARNPVSYAINGRPRILYGIIESTVFFLDLQHVPMHF